MPRVSGNARVALRAAAVLVVVLAVFVASFVLGVAATGIFLALLGVLAAFGWAATSLIRGR